MPDSVTLDTPETGSYGIEVPVKLRDRIDPIPLPSSTKHFTAWEDEGYYKERTANYSPYTDHISMDQSVTQLVAEFPWELRSNMISRWLGYQYKDGTKLKRVLPVAHPYFEFMRCRRVLNIRGMKWRGEVPRSPVDLGPAFPRPKFADYDKVEVAFQFETMPFTYKTDEQITHEHERYVYKRMEPGYETIYIEGGTGDTGAFKFDTISGYSGSDNPSAKVAFHNGRTVPLQVARVLWTWYDVPLEFITDANGKYTNFMGVSGSPTKPGGIGRINDAAFGGFPAYTLLCDVPQIDLRPNPIPVNITTTASYLANITFTFHYFEPPPDQLGSGVSTNLGHNMAMWRFDRKWYPVSINGAGTERVYKTFDFNKLFQVAQ